uniref:Uncharacterized protein n=1 Tax=Cannabis sativa TaxID=3483 RepID=A0A803Q470_CANSA
MANFGQSVIKLKLLIDTRRRRVLYGEAGKDFTDLLFSLLSMPVGTITTLLASDGIDMVGSIGNLYQSLEKLSPSYLQSNLNKDTLLRSMPSLPGGLLSLTNVVNTSSKNLKQLYSCGLAMMQGVVRGQCVNKFVSDDPTVICPRCKQYMEQPLRYVYRQARTETGSLSSCDAAEQECGIVKDVVTYMIMDDLQVKPISTNAVLNSLRNVEEHALLEKTVSVGIHEGLRLLKASLHTKTALTQCFIVDAKASIMGNNVITF